MLRSGARRLLSSLKLRGVHKSYKEHRNQLPGALSAESKLGLAALSSPLPDTKASCFLTASALTSLTAQQSDAGSLVSHGMYMAPQRKSSGLDEQRGRDGGR